MMVRANRLVRELSDSLFVTSVDVVLFAASLGLNLYAAQLFPKDPVTLVTNSLELARHFQRKLLSKSSAYARRKGWLKRKWANLELTDKGKRYLKQRLPRYRQHRPWDGRLYLITYDVRETKRFKRDLLRQWLRQEGAALIQKSVWVSVVDLTDKIEAAGIVERLEGTILVSSLKKGAGIGRESIDSLVRRVYRLEELDKRYRWWVVAVEKRENFSAEEKFFLRMQYLAILKDDPQLPKGLLPQGWQGDEAWELYRQKLKL